MCLRWVRLPRFLVVVLVGVVLVGAGNDVRSWGQDSLFDRVARALLGSRNSQPSLLTAEDAPIQVARDQLQIGITNAYDPSGIRYLATRLRIKNSSSKELLFHSNACRLEIGADIAPRVTTAQQLNNMPVSLIDEDPDGVDPLTIQGKDQLPIPPGQTRFAWLIFAPLPPVRDLPDVQLHLETSQGPLQLELTKSERSRLKVESERIGPRSCVEIARVSGELNILNLPDLVNQIERVRPKGSSALVISFQRGTVLRDPLITEWLVDGRDDRDNERMKYLPSWPGLFQSTVVVGLPGQGDETSDSQAATEPQAIRMVTRRLIPRLDSATLRQELQSGHPDFRMAILQDHGDLVAQIEPAALISAWKDESTRAELGTSLIRSMRSVALPEAVELLDRVTREESVENAVQALRSLNLSPMPGARQRAIRLARDPQVQKRIGLPRILQSVDVEVDSAWIPVLREAFSSPAPLARELALQQILSLGIPDRLPILEKAFADPSSDVRDTAYQAIVGQRSNEEEPLFVRETYRRFRSGMRDDKTLLGMGEIRDPALIPELLKSIDSHPDDDSPLIDLCIDLGGEEVLPELEKRFSRLPVRSQRRILRLMRDRGSSSVRELAISQLNATDEELRSASVSILVGIGDDSSYRLLREHLQKNVDNELGIEAIRIIGQSSTPQSKQFLRTLTKEPTAELRTLAQEGLEAEWNSSPNFNWKEVAQDLLNDGQKEGQIEALKLALEADDQNTRNINNLAFAYLNQSRPREARPLFDRALQVDPDSHIPVTGIAICIAVDGRTKDAIAMVDRRDLLSRWGRESLYLYNVACVYGRSIESLNQQPSSADNELLRRAWEDRAIQLLRNAVNRGFGNLALMESDPDLNSLRSLPAFQQLQMRK